MIADRIVEISLDALRPNPHQPRRQIDDAAVRELASSIERYGVLQPIIIKRDRQKVKRYVIVAGERRWRACRMLGRRTIQAILTSGRMDEIALVENVQRENLSALDEAHALKRLKERYAYTQAELAKVIGKGRSTVANLLQITTLPKDIQADCDGASKSLLIEISKERDPQRQRELWEKAKQGARTVRQVRVEKRGANLARRKSRSVGTTSDSVSARSVDPLLAEGEAFLMRLEAIVEREHDLDNTQYEALLELYRRFVGVIEKMAETGVR